MSDLNRIVSRYALFEAMVQAYINNYFRPYCSTCADVCCKPDFCRETLDSVFLTLLRQTSTPAVSYRKKKGWLTETGCILKVGRPPVCYEYLCDNILAAQPAGIHRYVDNVLSKLISHTGKRAYRGKHLVEILELSELKLIELSSFNNRLRESEAAFQAVRSYHEHNYLSAIHWKKLTTITPSPMAANRKTGDDR